MLYISPFHFKFSLVAVLIIAYGLLSIIFGILKIDHFFWYYPRNIALKTWADKSDRRFINIVLGSVCLILGLLLLLRK
jgi:hypothetical protein